MKKIFTLLTAILLSASMAMQAQLFDAVNDNPQGVLALLGDDSESEKYPVVATGRRAPEAIQVETVEVEFDDIECSQHNNTDFRTTSGYGFYQIKLYASYINGVSSNLCFVLAVNCTNSSTNDFTSTGSGGCNSTYTSIYTYTSLPTADGQAIQGTKVTAATATGRVTKVYSDSYGQHHYLDMYLTGTTAPYNKCYHIKYYFYVGASKSADTQTIQFTCPSNVYNVSTGGSGSSRYTKVNLVYSESNKYQINVSFSTKSLNTKIIPTGTYPINNTSNQWTVMNSGTSANTAALYNNSSTNKWYVESGEAYVLNPNQTQTPMFFKINFIRSLYRYNGSWNNRAWYGSVPALRQLTVSTSAGANGSASISCAENHGYPEGGFTKGSSGNYYYDGTNVTLVAPDIDGYEFVNWTKGGLQVSKSQSYAFSVSSSNSGAYVANYEAAAPTTYSLTWDPGDGELVGTAGVDYTPDGDYEEGETIIVPHATREGYHLTEWDGDAVNSYYPDDCGTEKEKLGDDEEYVAKWTANTHNVSWVTDGNALTGTYTNGTTAYGTTIDAPNTPTKNATAQYTYTFNGWSPAVDATMPDNDVTYTATWTETPVNYTLTWTTDGDALTGTYTSGTVAYGTAIAAPNTPTKTGYTFKAWSPAVAETMPAANTEYTATWTEDKYTLAWNANGGNITAAGTAEGSYTAGTSITAPTVARTGYTPNGWSPSFTGTMPSANTEYVAQWNTVTYNLSYEDLGGATHSNPTSYTIETETFDLANPGTRTGYTFTGWTCGGNAITQIAVGSTGDKTITANWTPNNYTLAWITDGDELTGDYTSGNAVAYGATIVAPNTPTKTGYTFNGWDPAVAETMPAANTTYTATWTANTYKVVFNKNNASATGSMEDQEFAYGTAQNLTTNGFSLSSYDFIGWATTETGEVVYTDAAEVINLTAENAATIYLYAQWRERFELVDDKLNGDEWYGLYDAKKTEGKALNVVYKRAFTKDQWAVISLPFGYSYRSAANQTLRGQIYQLVSAKYTADGYLTLNCMPATSGIVANRPYVVIPKANFSNPVFENVKLKDIATNYYTVQNTEGIGEGVEFRNTINREMLAKDKRVVYISSNRLYYPNLTADSYMRPFRGYFYLNITEEQIQYSPARIRLVTEEGENIETLPEAAEETSVETKKYIENGILIIERAGIKYDAQGHKLN